MILASELFPRLHNFHIRAPPDIIHSFLCYRVFKRAARINAQKLILVGSAEWQKGMVGVKILSTGEQYEVKVNEL